MRPWQEFQDFCDEKGFHNDENDFDDFDDRGNDDNDVDDGYIPHHQVRTDDDSASVASSVAPTNIPPQPSPGWTLTPAQQVPRYLLDFA